MKIYKFDARVEDKVVLNVPVSAVSLKVGSRSMGYLSFWYLADPNEKGTREDYYRVVGTGHDIPDIKELEYVDTVVSAESVYIWHIFKPLKQV